ncbi:MAG TPA: leucine--tRNA ligase [bacterium]|nr:leucine--tRNA ligase [bacterium]
MSDVKPVTDSPVRRLADPAAKWQKRWDEMALYRAPELPRPGKKYFVMPMLPYPSGDIHMGHFRNYTMTDAIARRRMMQGYDVLHPIGWDAFGLPAEQAAIKRGLHPEKWTYGNIAQSKATLQKIGLSFDWSREIFSCRPDYYKWTQWMFLQLHKHGLVYRKASQVNYCEYDNTVLANEQAAGGVCWRCGNPVTKKDLTQWYIKITDYADRLQADLDKLPGWPDHLKSLQRNWIGKSTGAEVDFRLPDGSKLTVFTTRPDTICGVTFMAIAPDAPLLKTLAIPSGHRAAVDEFVRRVSAQLNVDRMAAGEKSGVDTGVKITNPVTHEQVPLWVADYVLAGYGTGALMGVPAHDERDFAFARRYGLPIKPVIRTGDSIPDPASMTAPDPGYGTMVNSGRFDGLAGEAGIAKVIATLEAEGIGRAKVQFHLTDWLVSRQRYWGAPIPMIHCETDGIVPVPESDLPVLLPQGDIDYLPKGRSPLADVPSFMNVTCPKCGRPAQRDPDTMDTFMCSSWYFLRYIDPHNDQAPFDKAKAAAWLPIDYYMGGITHATGHLIYFRFFTKFLKDIGWLTVDEPATIMFNHGMVLDAKGEVMSKSKGNVVSPIDVMERHGVDPTRLTMFFATPGDREVLWSGEGIVGIERFLMKVDRLVRDTRAAVAGPITVDAVFDPATLGEGERAVYRKLHETIQRYDRDFEIMQLNTCVSAVMELTNAAAPGDQLRPELRAACASTIVRLLAPLAPHLAEEWWETLGFAPSIFKAGWPALDPRALPADTLSIAVQVNGKLRGQIEVTTGSAEADVVRAAEADPRIAGHLAGTRVRQIYVPGKLLNFVVKPG